ncbi:MAG: zinc-ribbon domain-containing protein [Thermoplasmata archaeon]|nr:zinc-ribbon domain-containing protein [Thermoplasmata archaeon]
MRCEDCGNEVSLEAQFCPFCGVEIRTTTKTVGTIEEAGRRTVDLGKKAVEKGKPVLKDAARLTGKALGKLGSATKKAGDKLKGTGE